MILHLCGEIRLSDHPYPEDCTRFDIRHGKAHQHGAGPARLAETALLVEAIAELAEDFNRGRGRFASQTECPACGVELTIYPTEDGSGIAGVVSRTEPKHIQDMEGEHFAVTQ